jgi:predicted nucleotidyltransferase component of viral defense system
MWGGHSCPPPLTFARDTYRHKAAPPFAVFEGWAPRTCPSSRKFDLEGPWVPTFRKPRRACLERDDPKGGRSLISKRIKGRPDATSTTGNGTASVFEPALSDPEGNEGESKGANKSGTNNPSSALKAQDAAHESAVRTNRGRAAPAPRKRVSERQRWASSNEHNRKGHGLHPCQSADARVFPVDFAEIRSLVIVALFAEDRLLDQLVLKGGNAITLIYGYGSRSSLDIDCSIDGDFANPDQIGDVLLRTLQVRFRERGIEVFDFTFEPRPSVKRPEVDDRWGGYAVEFKIIERPQLEQAQGSLEKMRRTAVEIGPSHQRIFRVDFSKYEFCGQKQQKELQDYAIYVYTPEMLSLEKLRAICQQMEEYPVQRNRIPRARDFYDIYVVLSEGNVDWARPECLELARNIFAAKDVPPRLIERIPQYRDFHQQDWPSVENSVSEKLEDFDFYVDFVVRESNKLKPLWIV